MKKLYFVLLSFLFGAIFGLGYVNGDIIDLGIYNTWNWSGSTYKMEEKQINFYETYEFYAKASDIGGYIWNIVMYLLIGFALSFVFLCLIFGKIGEKRRKGLIPFYNIYILFRVVGIKKIFFWLILVNIVIIIIFWFKSNMDCPNCTISIHEDGSVNREMYYHFSLAKLIHVIFDCLAGLYFSILMFIVYYRLFRKFGWKKLTSILGTIFLPIGTCILGFGNYEYQGENKRIECYENFEIRLK